uniref:Uncharacterized protein n=1 Tax=Anguilla anguilla TaxID=7936 RepID=A0A0E9W4D0_ANGAN
MFTRGTFLPFSLAILLIVFSSRLRFLRWRGYWET